MHMCINIYIYIHVYEICPQTTSATKEICPAICGPNLCNYKIKLKQVQCVIFPSPKNYIYQSCIFKNYGLRWRSLLSGDVLPSMKVNNDVLDF